MIKLQIWGDYYHHHLQRSGFLSITNKHMKYVWKTMHWTIASNTVRWYLVILITKLTEKVLANWGAVRGLLEERKVGIYNLWHIFFTPNILGEWRGGLVRVVKWRGNRGYLVDVNHHENWRYDITSSKAWIMSFTILCTSLQSLVMLAVLIASFSRSELPSDAAPYSNGLVHLLKQKNVKVHNININ